MASTTLPDPRVLAYIAAANAIPIEFPIDLLVANNPEAILSESRGTDPMMALLLAGKKIDRPAPPMVIIITYCQIGASVPSFVSKTRPINNVM